MALDQAGDQSSGNLDRHPPGDLLSAKLGLVVTTSQIVFACHEKACAPPPVGRGGSSGGGKKKKVSGPELKLNVAKNAYARARGETTVGKVDPPRFPRVNSQESGGNSYPGRRK